MAINISDELYKTLRKEVLNGQYLPGERMPSERDIAKKFDVSRGVAREAYKKLQQLGLLNIESSGSRVISIKSLRPTSPNHLQLLRFQSHRHPSVPTVVYHSIHH